MLFLEGRLVLSVQEGTIAAQHSTNAGYWKVTVTITMTAMATWSAVKTTAVATGGFQQALTGMMTAAMHQKKEGVMDTVMDTVVVVAAHLVQNAD